MQILKHGTIPKEKELVGYEVKCNRCKCIFRLTIEETYKEMTMSGMEHYWYCPDCGSKHETGQGGVGYCEYINEIWE